MFEFPEISSEQPFCCKNSRRQIKQLCIKHSASKKKIKDNEKTSLDQTCQAHDHYKATMSYKQLTKPASCLNGASI